MEAMDRLMLGSSLDATAFPSADPRYIILISLWSECRPTRSSIVRSSEPPRREDLSETPPFPALSLSSPTALAAASPVRA